MSQHEKGGPMKGRYVVLGAALAFGLIAGGCGGGGNGGSNRVTVSGTDVETAEDALVVTDVGA